MFDTIAVGGRNVTLIEGGLTASRNYRCLQKF